jgi:hypothetical protein
VSLGDEKVAALAAVVQTILETGNSSRTVIDKFAAALHQLGLVKEADLIHNAASVLWGQPSDIDAVVAYFEGQAAKERELLDSGRCNNPSLAQERWMIYKAAAQEVRARAWSKP